MTNKAPNPNDQATPTGETVAGEGFDLEERTARFGEAVIAFAKRIPAGPVNNPIVSQLVRAAISIGANYCEADEAESRKEFCYRVGISKQEAKETCFHVRMAVAAEPTLRDDGRILWQEAKELVRIFAAILRNCRK